jgi:hypothetical protein
LQVLESKDQMTGEEVMAYAEPTQIIADEGRTHSRGQHVEHEALSGGDASRHLQLPRAPLTDAAFARIGSMALMGSASSSGLQLPGFVQDSSVFKFGWVAIRLCHVPPTPDAEWETLYPLYSLTPPFPWEGLILERGGRANALNSHTTNRKEGSAECKSCGDCGNRCVWILFSVCEVSCLRRCALLRPSTQHVAQHPDSHIAPNCISDRGLSILLCKAS